MKRRLHSSTWLIGFVVAIMGLMSILNSKQVQAQTRPSLSGLQQQIDLLNQQLAALQQQVTQSDSALQQQIMQLQQQINDLSGRLTTLEQEQAGQLKVVDALGQTVGRVLDIEGAQGNVHFDVDGFTFVVSVSSNVFFSNNHSNELLFESDDCSGAPLFDMAGKMSPFFSPLIVVTGAHQTVYRPDPQMTPSARVIQSIQTNVHHCAGQLPHLRNFIVPALPVIDLVPLFTPPFSIR